VSVKDNNKTDTSSSGRRGGTSPSQDVSQADKNAAAGVPQGTGKRGLTGVPLGTSIVVGEEPVYAGEGRLRGPAGRQVIAKTQYQSGDGMKVLTALDNQRRADLLLSLSQIPGVYPRGKAPTKEYIKSMAQSLEIGIRQEDAAALEDIMKYADTVGVNYDIALNRFSSQPELAAAFYGATTAERAPAVIDAQSLIAEIADKFQDTFDVKINKKIAKQYAKEVQSAQLKKGARGSLSAQEREDILLKYIQGGAEEFSKLSGQGPMDQPRGVLGQYVQQLREEYYNNGLPMDEKRIYNMAVQSLRSPQELQNNKQKIQQRAQIVFPPLKEYIARGESVRDVLSPYMRLKSTIWEKNDTDINPSDMYDVMEGDKLRNINDYKMSLYKSPEYKKTQGYQEKTIGDVQGLLSYLRIG
jgi:hypothetical protein